MVTMCIAGSPQHAWVRRGLHVLLVLVFCAVQATALAHEVQHVMHLHDGPCGLHVAADHLAMAAAPDAPPAVTLVPVDSAADPSPGAPPAPPTPPSGGRAPPLPV
jgi:hypothetical protein